MRVSTSMMFETASQQLLQLQSGVFKLQNQMSTGRRVLTPADDPVAAAQALVVSQRQAVNNQFMDNQGNAASQLNLLEDRLGAISDLIQAVQERLVAAGNGGYTDLDRGAIAAEIRQRYDELLGYANSSDASGQYIFSGFRGATQPFMTTGAPGSRTANYLGDEGQRQLQVETGRLMEVSESGSDVFMRIREGNGQFKFSAAAGNQGTGILGSSSVVSGYDRSTYTLNFVDATTYTVSIDGGAAGPNQTYTSGQDILLGPAGQQFRIALTGTPAAGDSFTVAPSSNQDLFKTLDDMIAALEAPVSVSSVATTNYRNRIINIGENLDQALDNVLRIRTGIGARMVELDSLTNVGGDLDLQYRTDLSKLQDLDYTKAISEMANQQMVLQAAQLTFKQSSQLSLFNIL